MQATPQNEATPFYPRSPYAAAKLYAHWITVNYREAYGIHASNGILFNHEGPTRAETFVTRKITRAVAAIHLGFQDKLFLGNLDAKRDWGHARDYVDGMWRILQQPEPGDYVLATGETHSVREFAERAFAGIGIEIGWRGAGVDEQGFDKKSGRTLVAIDPRYCRPTEVDLLLGDPGKAFKKLGWKHTVTFSQLVSEMVASDLIAMKKRGRVEGRSMAHPSAERGTRRRIWVAGHRGMVGSAILRRLAKEDVEILTVDRRDVDLREQQAVRQWVARTRPDAIILAAAKVGGIIANDTYPAEFLFDNLAIETNVIQAAHLANVERLVFLGSSCIYPKFAPQPIKEEALLTGPLEPTNEWYAIAKIAGIKLCQAYRRQYGRRYISVMPCNLYGPNDNFDLATSHVLPALIRKFHAAKAKGETEVTVWGTGTPCGNFFMSTIWPMPSCF